MIDLQGLRRLLRNNIFWNLQRHPEILGTASQG